MSIIYKDLGDKIRKYRKAKHYSTAEFAERLNVSAGLVNNIENGRNDVFKLELLTAIMKELDIPLEELFKLEPVSIRPISVDANSQSFFLEQIEGENNEEISIVNQHLNYIVRAFLTTVSEYGCSKTAIEEISRSTSTHLEVIRNLKKI